MFESPDVRSARHASLQTDLPTDLQPAGVNIASPKLTEARSGHMLARQTFLAIWTWHVPADQSAECR